MIEALVALEAETSRAAEFLASLDPDDWDRPTRCPPMTLFHLAAHAWRGGRRILEMKAAGPVDAEPEKDGSTYFQYDPAEIGPGVVERAAQAAAGLRKETFAREWTEGWSRAIDEAAEAVDAGDRVYAGVFGLIKMSEYARTRVVEVTIHVMDLRDAVACAPDPTKEGLTVTCDVLRDLLGTDPREMGIDDERFALTGTGRETLSERERELLGPLADAFPLIS